MPKGKGLKPYYCVYKGHKTGIFKGGIGAWDHVSKFVNGYKGAIFKGGSYDQCVYLLVTGKRFEEDWIPPPNWRGTALQSGIDLRVYDPRTHEVIEEGYSYNESIKETSSSSGSASVIIEKKLQHSIKRYFSDTNEGDQTRPRKIAKTFNRITVYCDGSSLGNGKMGATAGLGVWFGDNDSRNISESLPGYPQTNNRAEILACIRAIETINSNEGFDCEILIATDSQYVIKMVTDYRFRKSNQRMEDRYKNMDLFEQLFKLVDERAGKGEVKFQHVAGHAGIHGNEMADMLARQGAMKSI
ncbi:ribonuclease H-like domain-containing protein [Paraphysoderma sedebokerense]|nr:ribonuclease H-like domain-containing protein [Paraphysoderma sedebokerense]